MSGAPQPFVFRRPVRFEEVDAARIVFFARFFYMCHDAMEAMFGSLDGGYERLIVDRDLGFPAVHAECDYSSPLRYGDAAKIAVTVNKIGTTAITFGFDVHREKDGVLCARATQTSVMTKLSEMKKHPIPDDVRAILESHRSP